MSLFSGVYATHTPSGLIEPAEPYGICNFSVGPPSLGIVNSSGALAIPVKPLELNKSDSPSGVQSESISFDGWYVTRFAVAVGCAPSSWMVYKSRSPS